MEERGAHMVLVVKPEGMRPRGIHRCRWNVWRREARTGFWW